MPDTLPRPHRAPDLHAPRFRPLVAGTCNQPMYALLRQTVPAVAGLSDRQLKALLVDANEGLADLLLGIEGVELPGQLGHLFIASCPHVKRDAVDQKASAEAGYRIRQLNHDTDGHTAKVMYSTQDTRYHFKHHELYGFKACKNLRRAISRRYPGQWQLYPRLEPDRKTRGLLARNHRHLLRAASTLTQLASYDELAL